MTHAQPKGSAGLPVLSARKLQRSFGAVVAAADVSIDVAAGERLCLIGSNGAGKTTFVNMVTGYLKPTAGSILLAGEDITRRSPHEITRRGVARSFQIPQLCLHMTVLENILLAFHCSHSHRHVSRRPPGNPAARPEVRLRLADRLRARAAADAAEGNEDPRRRPLRQLAREPREP
jgi:ABC-type branched-subunit amino acid transport system ATPase component